METDTLQDEPLPAPTGPRLMAMFLEPGAQSAGAGQPATAAAADAQRPSISPGAQVQPDTALRGSQQPPVTEDRAQQQPPHPMTRVEFEACVIMHGILAKFKDADPFRQPVDAEALGIPDYYDIIKQPMDLKTVRENLRAGKYKTVQDWRADLQLIWDNARKYNGDNHPVTNQALKLQTAAEQRWEGALQQAKAEVGSRGADSRPPFKAARASTNKELNSLLNSSLPASSESDSQEDVPLAGRASGARLANGGASGATQQRSPEPSKPGIKRERDGADASGRAAKRKPPAGGVAAGSSNQGLDLDALTALLNTPMARQLGAEEPDDLAFLALWKRLMARKQQLAASAADPEPVRQLRANLASAQATIGQLQQRLKDESVARQAAVAAKEGVEEQLGEVTKQLRQLQQEYEHQKGLLEQQRALLEQQQGLLRKFARQKQAATEQQQRAVTSTAGSAGSH